MKNVIRIIAIVALCAPALMAQNHGEIGVFADYFRLQSIGQNFLGAGGRVSLNVHPNIALEAEGAYDFERSNSRITTVNGVSNFSRSNLRITHGLFGPKFQLGHNFPLRAFVTAKGGFTRFGVNTGPATFGNATSNVGAGRYQPALYLGGGGEAFIHWLGIRVDIGDEIYFDRGANHNLRVSAGPHIRF